MDRRLVEAKHFVAEVQMYDSEGQCDNSADEAITGLIAFAEERERVNVGLLAENSALKAKARQPEAVDLSATSSADLLAELTRRLET